MLLELQEQELRLMVRELEFLSWPPVRKRLALELHSGMLFAISVSRDATPTLAVPTKLLSRWSYHRPSHRCCSYGENIRHCAIADEAIGSPLECNNYSSHCGTSALFCFVGSG